MNLDDQFRLLKALESDDLSVDKQYEILNAIESGKGSADNILGSSRRSVTSQVPTFDELRRQASGKDEGFDYETGAKGRIRTELSFMETPEEKENLLIRRVGEEGFTKASSGRLSITPDGQSKLGYEPIDQNLVIEEEGFSLGRDLADVAGIAPETIGSIIGGVIGAPKLIGGAVGAGAGAAGGQLLEEGIESLLGLQEQSAGEVAKEAALEGALAGTIDLATMGTFKAGRALIQGAGKGANAAARAMGQGERQLGSAQADQALRIMDEGGLPSYEAAGMPAAISRASQIAEAIGGKEQRAVKNVLFALEKKKKLLDSAGVATVDDLASVIGSATPAKANQLTNALKDAQKAHMDAIDETVGLLTQSTRKGAEVDDFVLKTLTDNYENFIKTADAQWKGIDDTLSQVRGTIRVNGEAVEATGGEIPIFDIQSLKTGFDDVISSEYAGAGKVAPEEFMAIGQQIEQLSTAGSKEGFTSFNGMKNLRKNIQDVLMDPKLSLQDTTPRRLLSDMRDRIDDMMYGDVPIKLQGVGRGNAPKIKQAMKQLKDARAAYKAEIGLFSDLEKLNILRNFGEAGRDVKLVVGRYFDDIIKSPKRVEAVLKASKENAEEVRQALAQKYIDDALFAANKDFADPTKFNGVQFNSKIQSLGKSGKAIFGDDWGQVQNLSRSLAYGGIKKIDDDVLERIVAQNPTDNIVTSLKSIRDAQIGLDEAMSTKVLRDLAEGRVDPEEAAAVIISPKTTRSQMNRILRFFDNDVKAQDTIRRTIVNDIMGAVDEDIFINEKAAYSLRNAINAYKPEMLEKVLGKQTFADMKELADDLVFLRDTGKKGAGSLAADAIRTGMYTNPLKNIPKAGRFKALNYMLNNPATMRRALEVKAGRTTPEAAARGWMQAMNESTEQVTGSGVPITERMKGVGKGIGATLGAVNQGQVGTRQAVGQLLTSPQQIRGTEPYRVSAPAPSRTSVPEVSMPEISLANDPNAQFVQQQLELRERAKRNPYVASTLLGGLGSAGLL